MTFWNIMWFIFVAYLFIAYLMVLFSICADLFRDKEASGVTKALWVLALILLPFLSVVVYLITRGSGMSGGQGGHGEPPGPGSRVIA